MKKIAMVGVPFDSHSSYLKGPAKAPDKVQQVFNEGSLNMTSEHGVAFEKHKTLYWDSTIACSDYHNIESVVAEKIDDFNAEKTLPIFIGGDHSVSYPIVKAMSKYHPPMTILHFDAHPDLYDEFKGNRYSNACPFARIMEEGLAKHLIQVGIRTMNAHQRAQADKFNVDVIEMKNLDDAMKLDIQGPVYISFDIDALDPSCAPGVSHIEPGGLSVRDVLNILHRIDCAVIGADVVEYNPNRDINDMTAYASVKLVKEIAGMMMS